MAKTPFTFTVITDTLFFSNNTGTEGKAYDAANGRGHTPPSDPELLLKEEIK